MLKLTYTETGMHLEHLEQSLERVITQRVMLALRLRHTLLIEPGTASLLLPLTLVGLEQLRVWTDRRDRAPSLCRSDQDSVELSLPGIWLAAQAHCEEGVFLVEFAPDQEQVLIHLWRSARAQPSSLRR